LTHIGGFYFQYGKYKKAEEAWQNALQLRETIKAPPLDIAVSLEKLTKLKNTKVIVNFYCISCLLGRIQ
jgi:hypothetical protein